MAYASVGDFKAYAGNSTAEDDMLIFSLLQRSQSIIDRELHTTFEAMADDVRYFDAVADVEGRSLYLGCDLCAITSIVNGDGVPVLSSEYVTEPRNQPPFYEVKLLASSGKRWTFDADPENAIAITGRWAYSQQADDNIKQATVRLANYLYKQKDSGVFDVVMLPGSGEMIVPQGIPVDVELILRTYRRKRP